MTRTRWQRFASFPLTRIVLAIFITALAGGLSLTWLTPLASASNTRLWPEFVAAAVMLLAYAAYVRIVERRAVSELSPVKAAPELGAGLLGGIALVACVAALIAALGAYRIAGMNAWSLEIVAPLATMTFVGVLEEILSRAIVFRITEESLGSWAALAISSLLFGLAHAPGEGVGVLASTTAVVAGVMFAAAYMLTRRLWLALGIHVAWNYTLGSILSVAVSGRESVGLFAGTLAGPDLLTGGAYGFEASVVTLVVLAIVSAALLRAAWLRGNFIARSYPGTRPMS